MKILVTGGGGFIGGYLVSQLLHQGHEVVSADIKPYASWEQRFDRAKNHVADMREKAQCYDLTKGVERIYNLACNMGGMGFIQNNHALCMESVLTQVHLLMAARDNNVKEILYSSSACIYPVEIQSTIKDASSQGLKEEFAYPANPEDGYGWEKLFSEIITEYFRQDFNIDCRICRYHNVYGPHGTWKGGREKVPAALCRKVAEGALGRTSELEIWGDGEQTRSFMYIDDCLTGMDLIWEKGDHRPLNLGTDEMVSINQVADLVEEIAGTKLRRTHNLGAPQGVRGRNSDNSLIKEVLGWAPSISLRDGLEKTYEWIYNEVSNDI